MAARLTRKTVAQSSWTRATRRGSGQTARHEPFFQGESASHHLMHGARAARRPELGIPLATEQGKEQEGILLC